MVGDYSDADLGFYYGEGGGLKGPIPVFQLSYKNIRVLGNV